MSVTENTPINRPCLLPLPASSEYIARDSPTIISRSVDMSTLGAHDTAGHTAQVVNWFHKAGCSWQFAFVEIGPSHNAKWLAGLFSKCVLFFKRDFPSQIWVDLVDGVLLPYRYSGHGSKKKHAKDDCCRKILDSNLC